MRVSVLLRPVAASALLFAAACGGSGTNSTAGNDAVNEAFADLDEALPDDGNAATDDVDLVSLPPTPAGAPATETAPLAQAAEIATGIDSGAGVERIPYEGGWAWRRDGRIVRTASRDGRRVSYFRPGDSAPFLVQQGEETFGYAGGRPQRAFDRSGRPGAVPPQRQEEARRLGDQSRRDREQAERAPRPTPVRPAPTPDADRGGRGAAGENRAGEDRPDRGGRETGSGRDDRGGARGDRGSGNRSDDDRRSRGGDDRGNRQ